MNIFLRVKHSVLDYLRLVYHTLKNKRTRDNFKRYIFESNKKKYSQIRQEIAVLKKYWGCFPMQYYTHDFYSKECTLSLDEMKTYIPGYFFYKILFPQYDDVRKISPLLDDKLAMNYLFRKVGVPHSDIIVVKKHDRFSLFSGEYLDHKELDSVLASQVSAKLFIKPNRGCGGAGILVAVRQSCGKYAVNGLFVDSEFLSGLTGDYVVETSIVQSPYISEIYSGSVNTLRAITKREADGQVSLVAATLRMGINGSQIDNGSAGGILIGINLSTGRSLRNYATFEFGLEKFTVHPDTLFPFKDLLIPDWDSVRLKIVNSAEKLSQINLVGWDAAITDKGVVMIEANTLFGLDHTQSGVGGLRDLFLSDAPGAYYERS